MSFSSVTVVRPYEQIVSQIQREIREGNLPRGARLPTERELAESFGVSRSVVREAIKVLAAIGLVESRQGSGLYVRNDPIPVVTRAFILSVSPDAESVDRLFEFRQVLESEAARLAAARRSDDDLAAMREAIALCDPKRDGDDWDLFGRADSQLHLAIAHASGNPYLEVAIATAREMQRDVVRLFADHPGSMQVAVGHHQDLVAAIERGEADAAATIMTDHIGYTGAIVHTTFPVTTDSTKEHVDAS
jgi:GntR family transcriptional repressor for pyruvate dehydrogenase complex